MTGKEGNGNKFSIRKSTGERKRKEKKRHKLEKQAEMEE